MSTSLTKHQKRDVGMAYLLWIPGIFGFCGLHRFYSGRYISGAIWLLTGGFCGIGQVVDLFFMPKMIDDHNQGREVW